MAKIRKFSNFSNLEDFPNFTRFVSAFIQELMSQFNGKIDFVENIHASGIHTVTFSGTTVTSVSHNLGSVPNGFIVISRTAAFIIYKPSGSSYAWTNSTIYLQSNGSMTASIYIV